MTDQQPMPAGWYPDPTSAGHQRQWNGQEWVGPSIPLGDKKKGGFRWHAEVRSTNVPADMRRLGDLRLECKVMVAVAKEEMPLWVKLLVNSFLLTTDWCSVEKLQLSSRSDRMITSATLVDGAVRKPLEISEEGMGFVAPLGERQFSDDARIEFQFADSATATPAPAAN